MTAMQHGEQGIRTTPRRSNQKHGIRELGRNVASGFPWTGEAASWGHGASKGEAASWGILGAWCIKG